MEKKDYTPREAAVALLDKVKAKAAEFVSKRQSTSNEEKMEKAAPQSETSAEMAELKIPSQAQAPKANEKTISSKPELKLKKFLAKRETKHDRCARKVAEQSPDVKNSHAVCVSAGVKPSKWSK